MSVWMGTLHEVRKGLNVFFFRLCVNTEALFSDSRPSSGGLTTKDSDWNVQRGVRETTFPNGDRNLSALFDSLASGSVPSAELPISNFALSPRAPSRASENISAHKAPP